MKTKTLNKLIVKTKIIIFLTGDHSLHYNIKYNYKKCIIIYKNYQMHRKNKKTDVNT